MKIIAIAVLFFVTTSCFATVQTSTLPSVGSVVAQGGVNLDKRLKIPAYPKSQIIKIDGDDDGTVIVFSSFDSIDQINAYFHREIVARGYTRTKYEIKNNRTAIEADYKNAKQKFEYKLQRQSNSNQFKLEFNFDN
ncbi:MAG: hypothetical protein ACK41E_10200 [Deinococcales bacterium]